MKKLLLFIFVVVAGIAVVAQTSALRPNLKSEKASTLQAIGAEPQNSVVAGEASKIKPVPAFKSTDVVSIINMGTAANAYGQANSGRANLNVNNTVNLITNFHRMGGDLDPGGYSGDLGYDVTFDQGAAFNSQIEVYVAQQNAGGEYFLDAARYPQHGLYNPPGNTDPNEAYVAFLCPTTGTSNGTTWGGYCWGRSKVGDPSDTTYNFVQSPGGNTYYYVPDGFSLNNLGEMWVTDINIDWTSGSGVYLNELMVPHGIWDEEEDDFVVEFLTFELETVDASPPANTAVEFSPDGQIGYIAALADIGEVEISEGQSYYPVLFRTEDGGETWSDPIPVALAGDDGIEAVLNYLSDEEIAELFLEPLPDRDEIPFTTAFDMDLSVDAWGNPHIAVVVGVTGGDPYSILTGISPSSGYAFTSCFLLSSDDQGNEGSWTGIQMGRPVSFRGAFGELEEDNRIQISRDQEGYKMFVAWIDTDTTVSLDNNAPDIWARGYDLISHQLTPDPNGDDKPTNVTFGSEATFSAYYFGMGNEVLHDGDGTFIVPFSYQNMTPTDPIQPVQFKYIQDFSFDMIVGVDENPLAEQEYISVSQSSPNPANAVARFNVSLNEPSTVEVKVTNMMGQIVRVLPPKAMQAGSNAVAIPVADLAPGIYFYSVEAGSASITKKMIVK